MSKYTVLINKDEPIIVDAINEEDALELATIEFEALGDRVYTSEIISVEEED
jgi:hypothetical protein